ncbi:hypothetical protein GCM10008905_06670 [Clostridium malenominatum]|uniref:FHA domain-containing protein n=1 Tax=Clostridium malenominatum TaxID=1539 RepID=A0ABN1IQ30_9CLOT
MKKYFKYFTGLMVALMIFTACGSSKKASHVADSSTENKAEYSIADKGGTTSGIGPPLDTSTSNNIQLSNRKIIQNATVEIQTLEFDKSSNDLINKIKAIGGYVENSNVSGKRVDNDTNIQNRHANISARIPAKNFEAFLKDMESIGSVVNQNINSNDITSQYFDTEARLKSLTIQQERLLELLKKSGELKDILEIEKELERVRYEIETLTGTLKKWNNLIDYTTININLYEVQKYKKANPLSLKDKAYYAFVSSIENVIYLFKLIILFIISSIPYLVVLIPILFVIKYFYKNKNLKVKNLLKKDEKDN